MATNNWHDRLNQIMPWGSSTCSKAPQFLPEEPEVILRGKGCRVYDQAGREYIDYRNGLGPISLGYCYPAVDEAILAQLQQGIIFGHPSPLECEVAELLGQLIPCAEQARFLKTGGEALAACIRLARSYTGKEHIIQIGYNGWLNSLASGANLLPSARADHYPPGVPAALSDLHHVCAWNDQAGLEELFSRFSGQVAAVMVAADYAALDQGETFYPFLRQITRENDSLLIFDEVVTGFRLAVAGVQEYFKVVPDLAVFGKAMANGMPLAAYVGQREIMDKAVVSSTFGGETLSLAAAKAVIQEYQAKDVVGHFWRQGEKLWTGLADLFATHGLPFAIKGFYPCPLFTETDGGQVLDIFLRRAFANGVSLYRVPYVNFSHKDRDIQETLDRLDKACKETRSSL
jgi:glutamate-1-semialdehyde 2,1-aminomutase